MTLANKATAHDHHHARDHAGHTHAGHNHAGHDLDHHNHDAHGDSDANRPQRANPGFSLLRMSSLQRLALALALVAAIWLSVFWAWA